jgi:hypothetical protein
MSAYGRSQEVSLPAFEGLTAVQSCAPSLSTIGLPEIYQILVWDFIIVQDSTEGCLRQSALDITCSEASSFFSRIEL